MELDGDIFVIIRCLGSGSQAPVLDRKTKDGLAAQGREVRDAIRRLIGRIRGIPQDKIREAILETWGEFGNPGGELGAYLERELKKLLLILQSTGETGELREEISPSLGGICYGVNEYVFVYSYRSRFERTRRP